MSQRRFDSRRLYHFLLIITVFKIYKSSQQTVSKIGVPRLFFDHPPIIPGNVPFDGPISFPLAVNDVGIVSGCVRFDGYGFPASLMNKFAWQPPIMVSAILAGSGYSQSICVF